MRPSKILFLIIISLFTFILLGCAIPTDPVSKKNPVTTNTTPIVTIITNNYVNTNIVAYTSGTTNYYIFGPGRTIQTGLTVTVEALVRNSLGIFVPLNTSGMLSVNMNYIPATGQCGILLVDPTNSPRWGSYQRPLTVKWRVYNTQ